MFIGCFCFSGLGGEDLVWEVGRFGVVWIIELGGEGG